MTKALLSNDTGSINSYRYSIDFPNGELTVTFRKHGDVKHYGIETIKGDDEHLVTIDVDGDEVTVGFPNFKETSTIHDNQVYKMVVDQLTQLSILINNKIKTTEGVHMGIGKLKQKDGTYIYNESYILGRNQLNCVYLEKTGFTDYEDTDVADDGQIYELINNISCNLAY